MKTHLLPIALLLIVASCTDTQPEVTEQEVEITDSASVEVVEEPGANGLEEGQELIWKLEGDYLILRELDEALYYQEPCYYKEHDIRIYEISPESNHWEIEWLEDTYTIDYAREVEGNIHITTDGGDVEFIFFPIDEISWSFGVMGYTDAPQITKPEYLKHFEIKHCEDAEAIMEDLHTTWYRLTEVDGDWVLYVPCEEAPDGLTIGEDGESIDFWSGSDPYDIVTMYKANNQIEIVYREFNGEMNSITIHSLSGDVHRFGDGNEDDELYVHQAAKDNYPTVKEECGEALN